MAKVGLVFVLVCVVVTERGREKREEAFHKIERDECGGRRKDKARSRMDPEVGGRGTRGRWKKCRNATSAGFLVPVVMEYPLWYGDSLMDYLVIKWKSEEKSTRERERARSGGNRRHFEQGTKHGV